MGIALKVHTGKATIQGKPTIKAGPSQASKQVTPKSMGTGGKKGG